jgi:hypothetical protein
MKFGHFVGAREGPPAHISVAFASKLRQLAPPGLTRFGAELPKIRFVTALDAKVVTAVRREDRVAQCSGDERERALRAVRGHFGCVHHVDARR